MKQKRKDEPTINSQQINRKTIMDNSIKMTKALEEYLTKCPVGKWFEIDDVMIKIPRTRYNLDRLVQAGKLKRKIFNTNVYDNPSQGQIHTLKYKTF